MNNDMKLDFSNDSIALAYDQVMVPLLFEPWTERLIIENSPWSSRYVLDLACGTGAVTKSLLNQVTCTGKVYALDSNIAMLSINKAKFEEMGCEDAITFIHASAEAIPIESNTLDIVVCQQGFQFFKNKIKATSEIYRVLRKGGRIIISTWLPIAECKMISVLCKSLEIIGEEKLSQLMRIPFDYMPKSKLIQIFEQVGFQNIHIEKQSMDLKLPGGIEEAITFIYHTPIGPQLRALSLVKQKTLEKVFKEKLKSISNNFGKMTTHILKATT